MNLKKAIFTMSLMTGLFPVAMDKVIPLIPHIYSADPSAHIWKERFSYMPCMRRYHPGDVT